MPLIRNSNAAFIARDAIVLDLGDLQEQGEEMLRSAKAEAAAIIAHARAERQRILAGAETEGFNQGLLRGHEQGQTKGREEALAAALIDHSAQLKQVEDSWLQALGEFSAVREDLVQGALRDVLRLAVTMAERITKRAIEVDPAIVNDQLAAVLAVVVRPTELVIRINPADRPLVEAALPRLLAAMPAIKHAQLTDDPLIDRGGCIARTRAGAQSHDAGGGEIDARIEVQLDRIIQTLLPNDPAARPSGDKSW